jgi:uncharacterized damage-inducible protein DinB
LRWFHSLHVMRASPKGLSEENFLSMGSKAERENCEPIKTGRYSAVKMGEKMDLAGLFLDHSRKALFNECWPRMRSTVEGLSDEQLWWRPNEASNSIGNLLLHLNGNVRQWLVTSFNKQEDRRVRSVEFAEKAGAPASALLARLGGTLAEAEAVLSHLTEVDLLAPMDIQGYHVTGLGAVYHVVEHFSMHYGQILYIAKAQQGKDLGFYSELNRTGRVEGKR